MLSRADVLWQRGLLALCALGLVQVGVMLSMKLHVADAGFHAQPTAVPYVDENDPAFVRLRATQKTVDLHGLDSQLRGDLVFPMVARGNLRGVIVLGPRSSGESYAPDELRSLREMLLRPGKAS